MARDADIVRWSVNPGSSRTHRMSFRQNDGTSYDPDAVTFTVSLSGADVTYTYSENPEAELNINRDGPGRYWVRVVHAAPDSTYDTVWVGTGPNNLVVVRTGQLHTRT